MVAASDDENSTGRATSGGGGTDRNHCSSMAEGSGGSDDKRARTSVAFVGSMGRICGGDGLFGPSFDGSAGRDAGRNAGMRDDGRGEESCAAGSRGRDDDDGTTLEGGDDSPRETRLVADAAGATLGTGADGRIDASG